MFVPDTWVIYDTSVSRKKNKENLEDVKIDLMTGAMLLAVPFYGGAEIASLVYLYLPLERN